VNLKEVLDENWGQSLYMYRMFINFLVWRKKSGCWTDSDLYYVYRMFGVGPKPERSNKSSGLIRNSYLLNKQMIIDNSWLGLANTQYERFTPFFSYQDQREWLLTFGLGIIILQCVSSRKSLAVVNMCVCVSGFCFHPIRIRTLPFRRNRNYVIFKTSSVNALSANKLSVEDIFDICSFILVSLAAAYHCSWAPLRPCDSKLGLNWKPQPGTGRVRNLPPHEWQKKM
jgi:hypothetical protein